MVKKNFILLLPLNNRIEEKESTGLICIVLKNNGLTLNNII